MTGARHLRHPRVGRPRRRRDTARRDDGFTLVELLISLVLSGIIAGVTVAALMTSMNAVSSTTESLRDSTTASLVSAYVYRDAQAAGGVDPATTAADPAAGVATAASAAAALVADPWNGCAQDAAFVAGFRWTARTATGPAGVVVTYGLRADHSLDRRVCQAGGVVDVVLGTGISSITATCLPNPACGPATEGVRVDVTGTGTRAPYQYTLTAALRTGTQPRAALTNSAAAPLLLLGADGGGCPNLRLDGTGDVVVLGDAVISDRCGAAPIGGDQTRLVPSGATQVLHDVTDPFAGRVDAAPASAACAATTAAELGESPAADATVIQPGPVTVDAALTFQPGHHVFCAGLTIAAGADVRGDGVVLEVVGGALRIQPGAAVHLRAPTSGDLARTVVEVAEGVPVSIGHDGDVVVLAGIVHAPGSTVALTGDAPIEVGALVARTATVAGAGPIRIGLPIPELTIGTTSLPDGEVSAAYPTTVLSVTGTSAAVTWSASGLPDGLAMSPSGEITGTPVAEGFARVRVTAVDATGAAASTTSTITVHRAPIVAAPATLADGQVGVPVPSGVRGSVDGGTAPYTWSATGLPPGVTVDAAGVLAGVPTADGTSTVTLSVTDAMGVTASRAYTYVVRPQLAVSGPDDLGTATQHVPIAPVALSGSGGLAPYAWSAAGLPPGTSIDAGGTLTGTPEAAGTYAPTVTVVDAGGASATRTYTVTVLPDPALADPSIDAPPTLPPAEAGAAFPSITLSASGGTAPYTWSASGLPSGMTMSAGGTLTGTPRTAGTVTITVQVVDTAGIAVTRGYPLTVAPAPTITGPAQLAPGQERTAYPAQAMTAADGVAPYAWTAAGLPPGLTMSADGVLSGTPTTSGTRTVAVTVTDAAGGSASASLALTIAANCAADGTGWSGEYFANRTLTGTPVLCRQDPALAFHWRSGRPAPSVPADGFSVRWTTTAQFEAGVYDFTKGSDDGWRMYVDGVLVLSDWNAQSLAGSWKTVSRQLAAGAHTIIVEYFEATGSADAQLTWEFAPDVDCPTTPSGWVGEYFDGRALAGTPVMCRDDAAVDFDWGSGSPTRRLRADDFSVRWTRTATFTDGVYRFTAGSDDGVRLYVDDALVIDRWTDRSYATNTVDVELAAGPHTLRMEYYERSGVARATLAQQQLPNVACPATITGWRGEYFAGRTLGGGRRVCRDDAVLDLSWGSGSPDPALPVDDFSARWMRRLTFTAGTHTFTAGSDDGVRVWVDGMLVVDRWVDRSYATTSGSIALTAGEHTVVVEYYEHGGVARAKLTWT